MGKRSTHKLFTFGHARQLLGLVRIGIEGGVVGASQKVVQVVQVSLQSIVMDGDVQIGRGVLPIGPQVLHVARLVSVQGLVAHVFELVAVGLGLEVLDGLLEAQQGQHERRLVEDRAERTVLVHHIHVVKL